MHFRSLTVHGLRGFADEQEIQFAVPTGEPGSGLTILVGPNNGGKTTIIEALWLMSIEAPDAIPESHRNTKTRQKVRIQVTDDQNRASQLTTVEATGGALSRTGDSGFEPFKHMFVLPSRRSFTHRFGSADMPRASYMGAFRAAAVSRGAQLNVFPHRLITATKRRADLETVLRKVIDPVPEWAIEKGLDGNFFLKFFGRDTAYTSEGVGDGVLSIFFLVDSLYDSDREHLIAVDEPELSLHPSLQRKLLDVFHEYSASRQIVYATHSPYFLDIPALTKGAKLVRVFEDNGRSHCASLSTDSIEALKAFLADRNNPHVFGLDGRESFFLSDGVVLVEGQDDVLGYRAVQHQLGVDFRATFFGWGVGGASKMRLVARILHDLKFRRVAGVLDADKATVRDELSHEFPDYVFRTIPAQDVRSRDRVPAREARQGLLDEHGLLREEYRAATSQLFEELARVLAPL
jgi:predicted ATP-dependent endonuclease of OLD family